MPRTLRIKVEDYVPEFIQLAKRGKKNLLLSHTFRTLEFLAQRYEEAWKMAAGGAQLAGLPFVVNGTGYPKSIKRRQISNTVWEVYSDYTTKTGLGVTNLLEKGHGLIDLKPGLLKGPKSRMGKYGRYNIVPSRHGTPGTDQFRNNPMPMSVYKSITSETNKIDAMKKAGATDIRGGTSYVSKSSALPGQRVTSWGSSYDPSSNIGKRTKLITKKGKRVGDYAWKSGKYAGMYRLQMSTQRAKRSGYMTFRVVSSRSDPMSWIVPEQAPWPVRNTVINIMAPVAEMALQKAMEADIK